MTKKRQSRILDEVHETARGSREGGNRFTTAKWSSKALDPRLRGDDERQGHSRAPLLVIPAPSSFPRRRESLFTTAVGPERETVRRRHWMTSFAV